MKRIVFICGIVSGLIVSGTLAVSMIMWHNNPDIQPSMVGGFASMILAFSLIVVGIKNYRDKVLGGTIKFGKAFLVGFYIVLIGSTMYVITWLICLYGFIPNFGDLYAEMAIKAAEKNGASAAEIQAKMVEMAKFKELYKNPLVVIGLTYMEILPLGTVIALIVAAILKKKPHVESNTINA